MSTTHKHGRTDSHGSSHSTKKKNGREDKEVDDLALKIMNTYKDLEDYAQRIQIQIQLYDHLISLFNLERLKGDVETCCTSIFNKEMKSTASYYYLREINNRGIFSGASSCFEGEKRKLSEEKEEIDRFNHNMLQEGEKAENNKDLHTLRNLLQKAESYKERKLGQKLC